MSAEKQIDLLAKVLLEEFGGPTENESACEMAVRLLRKQRAALEIIARYDQLADPFARKEGICAYGCDAPTIAQEALKGKR